MKQLIASLKQIGQAFSANKVGQLSAAISYTAVFAIGPLLLVMIAVVGLIFGQRASQGQLFAQLSSAVGPSTARTLQTMIASSQGVSKGTAALIIGAIGTLLGAAGLTSQVQNSFDEILGAVPDPKGGIKRTIFVKLKNSAFVILASVLVGASLVASALIVVLSSTIQRHLSIPPFVLELTNDIVSWLIFSGLLFVAYKVLPDVRIPHKVIWRASLIIALLFVLGKIVLAIIIGRNATANAYGAAAALVSLLLWVYYSAQIAFLGAVGMKVYAENHGLSLSPKRFTLQRETVTIDSNHTQGRLVGAWMRGYRKAAHR